MDEKVVNIQFGGGAVFGPRCFTQAFCSHEGHPLVAVHGLLIAVASFVTEHRL